MLGLALLGMLDTKARDRIVRPSYGFLDADYLELTESQPEIVELCFATAQPKVSPWLELDQKSHPPRLTVASDRYYEKNQVESGPRFSSDTALDALLRIVWGLNVPDKPKQDNEFLNEADIKQLGRALKKNFERGLARYFLVPSADDSHPLNREGVISALKYQLPYLFVFRTGVAGRPTLLSADFDETDVSYELTNFAKLF